ncbi:MAG: flagellar protein FlaG [Pseudobutyrivibrio sp.]|nr:flagellar protein FlaG [Pseudobutyrivibrio sp.]
MKVESIQPVNNSYQSQGSANVTTQSVTAGNGTTASGDMSMQPKTRDTVTITEDTGVKTGKIREEGQASNEQIRKAVDTINKNAHNEEAVFGIHEATNRVTIKIVDKDTKEVIKEFPPEKTLDMIAKVWEMAGIMVDERR